MKRLRSGAREHFLRRAAYEARHKARPRRRIQHREIRVVFAGHLDLIDNGEQTREQLARLDNATHTYSADRVRLYVDLHAVTFIDPCTLVHIAAQLDRIRDNPRFSLNGNYPRAEAARRAMRDAGFEAFIGIPPRLRGEGSEVPDLELRSGDRATGLRPRDWSPLPRFIKSHGGFTDDEAEPFYTAFGECVENVLQHAYRGHGGKWYALALRLTDRPARAVIADLGIGISRSIKSTLGDRLTSALQRGAAEFLKRVAELANDDEDDPVVPVDALIRQFESYDAASVYLATQGKRTETGDPKRGKGLSELRKAVVAQKHGALHVLSGRAAVTWRSGAGPQAGNLGALRGTIVCLELGAPRSPGEPDGT